LYSHHTAFSGEIQKKATRPRPFAGADAGVASAFPPGRGKAGAGFAQTLRLFQQ